MPSVDGFVDDDDMPALEDLDVCSLEGGVGVVRRHKVVLSPKLGASIDASPKTLTNALKGDVVVGMEDCIDGVAERSEGGGRIKMFHNHFPEDVENTWMVHVSYSGHVCESFFKPRPGLTETKNGRGKVHCGVGEGSVVSLRGGKGLYH